MIRNMTIVVTLGSLLVGLRGAEASPFAYVTLSSADQVAVVDIATNAVVGSIPVGSTPQRLAISPDGSRLYVSNAGNPNSFSVVDTTLQTVIATLVRGSVGGAAVTPDGSRAYIAFGNSGTGTPPTVQVLSTATNQVVSEIDASSLCGHNQPPPGEPCQLGDVAISPNGARAFVVVGNARGGGLGDLAVIDTATNTIIDTAPTGWSSMEVAMSPDGSRAYVANQGNTVSVIDTVTITTVATVLLPSPTFNTPIGVVVSPDGARVYVMCVDGSSVAVIDSASNTVINGISVDRPLLGAITSDGTDLYVTTPTGLSVIDTSAGMVVAGVPLGTPATGVVISSNQLAAQIQPPINADGTSVFRSNRGAVPVKFTLTQNGVPTCQLPTATIAVFRTSGNAPGAVNESVFTMPSDNGIYFRVDTAACQYVYNLNTQALGVGSYTVKINIGAMTVGTADFGLR
jgi:YVTN family beta-propeller protein